MLCEEIRRLRLAKGITQVRLAEKLGVSKQSVSNWENNNIQPSVDLLEKMADFFSVSTDSLLGRDRGVCVDVAGLSFEQADHIRHLIQDLRVANQRRTT